MNLRLMPLENRPREKMRLHGPTALTEAELVALFLGTGMRGRNAVELAQELLDHHGGLRNLLESADTRLPGVGAVKAGRLRAALELARRCLAAELRRGPTLTNSLDCAAFLNAQLGGHPYEVFGCVFLDNRNRVIAFEELFRGTVDGATVHAREVVRACLRTNAASVILAHNHPSGSPEPSDSDRIITRELVQALDLVGVRVLDHLVIGCGHVVSLAARGWV